MVAWAVDANVMIRWLERDDSDLASQADEFFQVAAPASVLLDRLVLAEIAYVLKSNYRQTKQQVVVKLLAVIAQPYFIISEPTLIQTALELYRDNAPLSLEDAWLLSMRGCNHNYSSHSGCICYTKW